MPMEGTKTQSRSHHAVFAETQQFFIKQRAAIQKLKEDNAKLKEELLLENKFSVTPTTANAAALISNLQEQSDVYTRKIGMERSRVAELEERSAALREQVAGQRKAMGGVNAAQESTIAMQKQMRILENRLEKAYHKYNESQSHNQVLRGKIDNLRRERLVFDDIFKKLEKSLQLQKKEMAGIIHISNGAFDTREKAIAEMAVLKLQSDKEQTMCEAEWKHLTQLLDADRQQRSAAREAEIAERERRLGALMKEGPARRRTAKAGESTIAKEKAATNSSMNQVQHYGEAFAKIQDATGIKDIDKLVERFMEAEDANFSLFNYVNEVNAEVEKLEDQIGDIKAEIDKYRGEDIQQETQRRKNLQEQEQKLAEAKERAALYEQKHVNAVKRVDQLKDSIMRMFEEAGCSTPAVQEMLGDVGITEVNMLQYLGILEQRTNEILQEYVAAVSTDSSRAAEKAAQLLGATGGAPAGMGSDYVIEPPSTLAALDSDDDRADDDDEAPLNREALEQKVQRSLAKRGDVVKLKPAAAVKSPPSPTRAQNRSAHR